MFRNMLIHGSISRTHGVFSISIVSVTDSRKNRNPVMYSVQIRDIETGDLVAEPCGDEGPKLLTEEEVFPWILENMND